MTALQVDSPVIGRDSELSVVDRWLAGPAAGPFALIIEGEAGVGKTTVWRHAIQSAEAAGMRVFRCQAAESELKLGYTGLADLLDSVAAKELDDLPAPQRQALEVALLRTEVPERSLDPRTVATALLSLSRALAATRPLVIAVDDVRWLDAPSAQALAFAGRRLDDQVKLIATTRASGELPIGLAEDRVKRLRLGPLSLAALHHLLTSRLGRSFPRLVLVKVHEASRGNPFHALEIGRALVRSGATIAPGVPLPGAESIDFLITERIAALPQRTREAVLFAAVADEVSLDTLALAGVGDPLKTLGPAIREGIAVQQGGTVRLAHPLMASAVIGATSKQRIREIHSALAAHSASVEARALHMGLAADGADARAADELEAAAMLASHRGAPIAAGQLLELASSLTPSDDAARRAGRILEAARGYTDAGAMDRAGALLRELVATATDGPIKARALQLLSQEIGRSYGFVEARDLAALALEAAGDDIAMRAGIEMDLAFCDFALGELASAAEHTMTALAHAEATGNTAIKALALACVTITEFFVGKGISESQLAESLALEDPFWQGPLEMRPTFIRGLLSLWTAKFDQAISIFSALRSEAIELGQDLRLPYLCFYLTLASLWDGDVAGAARYAAEGEASAALTGEPIERALTLSGRALISEHNRPPDEVRQAAGQALAIFIEARFMVYTTWPLMAMGLLELSLGDAGRVDGLLRPLADGLTSTPFGDPILGICLPEVVEAAIALGDFERANRYLGWLENGSARLDRPWGIGAVLRCRGMIAAAQGDLDSAIESFDKALIQHERIHMPFERARTLLAKGEVHRRRKEKRLAVEALGNALAIFNAQGAIRWSAQAQAELSRVGLRRKPDELTATEQLVAELAAKGMTNREVAETAFISPKTVEVNLARAYSKLGIRSRAQLARALDNALKSSGDDVKPTGC